MAKQLEGTMAGITKMASKGVIRLYRTFSYRDNNNKPQNYRKAIGKLDNKTQKPIFNTYFINLVKEQGLSLDLFYNIPISDIPKYINFGELHNIIKEKNTLNIDNSNKNTQNIDNNNILVDKNSQVKIVIDDSLVHYETEEEYSSKYYGPYLLIEKILFSSGLLNILKFIFNNNWESIVTIIYFLVSSNSSITQYNNWISKNELFIKKSDLKYQRINEIFSDIKFDQMINFFNIWSKLQNEDKYFALDIKSRSSYLNLIKNIEQKDYQDNDKSDENNLCLLFGEKYGLPLYSTMFSGSREDIYTLKLFIDHIEFFSHNIYNIILDKDFYNIDNINILLNNYKKYNFLVSVPLSLPIYQKIFSDGEENFDRSLVFKSDDQILFAYSFIEQINNDKNIKYYVFFNNYLYNKLKYKKTSNIIDLKEKAELNPEYYINNKLYNKYLIFTKDNDTLKYNIKINIDIVSYECLNKSCLIVVGNDLNLSEQDVFKIYKNKYFVENTFCKIISQLEINKKSIDNYKSINGKIFIATIVLIIKIIINNVMLKNNLFKNMTLETLFEELEKITKLKIGNKKYISKISNSNRKILEIFGIKIV
ncbi:MAG: hypothetical protein LBR11_11520 [Deltaproteobacteria bacterium]|jgi:hypothetical protein|nr:hypothetical protein [Deltaproteobacteria bacterium]